MLTKEEYEYLSQYSKQISQAYYHNYVTGAPSRKDLEKMNEIASSHNLKDPNMNYGCSKCQLNLLKRIGKLFYAYIPEEPETKPSLPETEEQPKKKNKETKPKSNETKNKTGNSTKRSTAGTKSS